MVQSLPGFLNMCLNVCSPSQVLGDVYPKVLESAHFCFNRSGAVRGHAVVCVERVEQGTQDTTLWGSYIQGDGVGGELAHFPHLRSASEEVLNPITE